MFIVCTPRDTFFVDLSMYAQWILCTETTIPLLAAFVLVEILAGSVNLVIRCHLLLMCFVELNKVGFD